MGTIEIVERFYCSKCDYMTYDKDRIELIRKLGGKCPACDDGNIKAWYSHYDLSKNPIHKRSKRRYKRYLS